MGRVGSLLYSAAAGVGVALLLYAVLAQRTIFLSMPNLLLSLFCVATGISILWNHQYELMSNIKDVCWMAILFFLIQVNNDFHSKEESRRLFRIVSNAFIIIWFIGSFISVCQFIAGYGAWVDTPYSGSVLSRRIGFVDGRLFGVYGDPNYAAVGSLAAIILSTILILGNTSKLLKTLYIISSVFQYFYILLSGSRTAVICMFISLAVIVFFSVFQKKRSKSSSLLSCLFQTLLFLLLCMGLLWLINLVVKGLLAYLPELFEKVCNLLHISISSNAGTVDFDRPDVVDSSDISNNRFRIWSDAISIWKMTPILGATSRGYLSYALDRIGKLYIVTKGYIIHNAYISVLLFTGILGTGILLCWLVYAVVKILRFLFAHSSADYPNYTKVLLLSAILVAEAVSGMALTSLFFAHQITDILFWFTVGYTFHQIDRPSEALM